MRKASKSLVSSPQYGASIGLGSLAQIPLVWLFFPIMEPNSDPTPLIGALLLTFQCLVQFLLTLLWRVRTDSTGISWGFILHPSGLKWEQVSSAREHFSWRRGLIVQTINGSHFIPHNLEPSEFSVVRRTLGSKLIETKPLPQKSTRLPILIALLSVILIAIFMPISHGFQALLTTFFGFSPELARQSLYSITPSHEFVFYLPLLLAVPGSVTSITLKNGQLQMNEASSPLLWSSVPRELAGYGLAVRDVQEITCTSSHDVTGQLYVSSILLITEKKKITVSSSSVNFPSVLSQLLDIPLCGREALAHRLKWEGSA